MEGQAASGAGVAEEVEEAAVLAVISALSMLALRMNVLVIAQSKIHLYTSTFVK